MLDVPYGVVVCCFFGVLVFFGWFLGVMLVESLVIVGRNRVIFYFFGLGATFLGCVVV